MAMSMLVTNQWVPMPLGFSDVFHTGSTDCLPCVYRLRFIYQGNDQANECYFHSNWYYLTSWLMFSKYVSAMLEAGLSPVQSYYRGGLCFCWFYIRVIYISGASTMQLSDIDKQGNFSCYSPPFTSN